MSIVERKQYSIVKAVLQVQKKSKGYAGVAVHTNAAIDASLEKSKRDSVKKAMQNAL